MANKKTLKKKNSKKGGNKKKKVFLERKLLMTDEQFKEYLLENYVDKDGNKISDRTLISSEKFMLDTGLFSIDEVTGLKIPCSLGNISYWKTKLNLQEYDVYLYHKNKTKRIKEEYSVWSNKTVHRVKKARVTNIYDMEIEKEIIIEYCGFPEVYKNYSPQVVRESAEELWEMLGLDVKDQFLKMKQKLTQRKNERNKIKEKENNKEKIRKEKLKGKNLMEQKKKESE